MFVSNNGNYSGFPENCYIGDYCDGFELLMKCRKPYMAYSITASRDNNNRLQMHSSPQIIDHKFTELKREIAG